MQVCCTVISPFSTRSKGKLLPLTRKALNQKQSIKPIHIKCRERTKNIEGKDPLTCEGCNLEMVLIFVCFTYNYTMTKTVSLKPDEVIPSKQIILDTG